MALKAVHEDLDAVAAATTGRKNLEASLASLKMTHDKALAEREREQKSFDAEKAKHDTERAAWTKYLSDLHASGPWSGLGYSWAGWDGHAKSQGIVCTPCTIVKGGDGILYACQ
jgi:hypothetical protein